MPENDPIDELMEIEGISKKDAKTLADVGIKSLDMLGNANIEKLVKLTNLDERKLSLWTILARASQRKKFVDIDKAIKELKKISDLKIEDIKKLIGAGVMQISDLAMESPELLAKDTGIDQRLIEDWIKKAQQIKEK